jgi:hypothetical protein
MAITLYSKTTEAISVLSSQDNNGLAGAVNGMNTGVEPIYQPTDGIEGSAA